MRIYPAHRGEEFRHQLLAFDSAQATLSLSKGTSRNLCSVPCLLLSGLSSPPFLRKGGAIVLLPKSILFYQNLTNSAKDVIMYLYGPKGGVKKIQKYPDLTAFDWGNDNNYPCGSF